MMQVAVAYLDRNFGENELNIVVVGQADFSQPLCQLIFCRRKGVSGVIVKGFGASEAGKSGFDGAQPGRQGWAHQGKTLVETRLFRIDAPEVGDHLLEFRRYDFVVFHLDVNSLDAASFGITYIDVARALVKQL